MFHRNPLRPIDRRDALRQLGAGFGTLGLASMLAQSNTGFGVARADLVSNSESPLAPRAPRAAECIEAL